MDLLTSLVERYGQGAFLGCPVETERDNAFLVVDPTEAYAVETAGPHWVYQEVQEVRAMNDVRVIRQDWDRISQGLASYAISRGWWSDDGSKLDFAGALGEDLDAHEKRPCAGDDKFAPATVEEVIAEHKEVERLIAERIAYLRSRVWWE